MRVASPATCAYVPPRLQRPLSEPAMLKALKNLIRANAPATLPAVPAGTRYYVIGDIHGRNDLFERLIAAIEEEAAGANGLDIRVILLGDLVDRGPESAMVISNARDWQKRRNVRILAGNHEEMFLRSFESTSVLRQFLRHGGRETILSYGMPADQYNQASLEELQSLMVEYIPNEDREFLAGFDEFVIAGDYVFVHAGIQPGIELEEQSREDLLWIRERFLEFDEPHPRYVVHGHTIFEQPDVRRNRIGIDTGAYRHGRLTALVLEGTSRRFIQAVDADGDLAVEKKDLIK